MYTLLLSAAVAGVVAAADVDLGAVEHKRPTKDSLKVPKTDDGVPKVGLQATVKGTAAKDEKRTRYVLVTPLSSPEYVGTWWVQREVDVDGNGFTAEARFGEEAAGAGEYFAVIGVATDAKWEVGDQVKELPAAAGYSKVKVVKRTE